MHLLYFHSSTLQSYVDMGKIRYLDALNPNGMFSSVDMVNLDFDAVSDAVQEEGVFRFTALGLRGRGLGRVGKLRAYRDALRRLSCEKRPALVMGDDANLLGLAARCVSRKVASPYAVNIYYDNDLHHRLTGKPALAFLRSRHLEALMERVVLTGAKGVYAGSRGYLDFGLRHGARPERAYLGSWSVDDVFYQDPPPPHPDSREILFVGRLHSLKYIDDLLAAIATLPSHVRLDVAGEGEDRGRLEGLNKRLALNGRVRFLGLISREELRARMNGARLLLATQGVNAVVECLLSGRPVVAYDHECNAEFVRHGETGWLVPFRDVPRLVDAIAGILKNPTASQERGRVARKKMMEECGIGSSLDHRRQFILNCMKN